jgi:ABC-type transport system involved in multi-copper enzyme maturation permease subunit
MIWLIAKKELYDNWQSRKITLAFALCVVLLTVSVWLGLKDYSARLSSYSLTRTGDTLLIEIIANYVCFDEGGKMMPNRVIYMDELVDIVGIYRCPAELSILAKGLEGRMNRPVRLINLRKFGVQAEVDTGSLQERNKLFALFPSPDFLFITKVVLSLLTILFAFDAIAGEREMGTLQLMLSNSVSRAQVLLGKFLGGYLSIVFLFLAASLIAFLLLAFSPSVVLNVESWLRILFLLLASLAYIAVFLLIGLFVSALTGRAATAVLMLLAIWAVVTLVLPNVGGLVAKQLVEVPSQQQIETEKFKKAREIEDEAEKRGLQSHGPAAGYGRWHPEVQPKIEESLKEIEEHYDLLRGKRLTLSRILTRFSPVGAYVYAAVGLAQTGIEDEKRYYSQLEGYKSKLSADMKKALEEMQRRMQKGELPPTIPKRPPEEPRAYRDWWQKSSEYPYVPMKNVFASQLNLTFEKLSLSETLRAISLDLSLLTLWMGLGFAFAMLALAKCEIR